MRRAILLLITLFAPLLGVDTELHLYTDREIGCYWSDRDGIEGYRITIDGCPAIDARTWRSLIKNFPPKEAARLAQGLAVITDEASIIAFEDSVDCGCQDSGPNDMCVRVTIPSGSGSYVHELRFKNDPSIADSLIFVSYEHI